MLDQNACRFLGRIAYDRHYSGMALDDAEGKRVAALFDGGKSMLFLANHGVMVVADSVAEAFDELYYLEQAARLQVIALSTRQPLRIVPDNVAALTCRQWREYPDGWNLHWQALRDILDIDEPDYQD